MVLSEVVLSEVAGVWEVVGLSAETGALCAEVLSELARWKELAM